MPTLCSSSKARSQANPDERQDKPDGTAGQDVDVQLNHLGQCVTDLQRSARFYCEVFGFERFRDVSVPDEFTAKLLRVEPPVGLEAVYLRRDGFTLELLGYARTEPRRDRVMNEPGLTHLSFSVQDLDAAQAAVVEHGGHVLDDTRLPNAVFVRDPDGQLIELLLAR
jgi:catechol 2,3-dioxygenase-like lactoylglutathione lyase family enzyme